MKSLPPRSGCNKLPALISRELRHEITTDHQDYAEWIIDIFQEREDFKPVFKNGFTNETQPNHIETHFEVKKREEGFAPIFMNYFKAREL